MLRRELIKSIVAIPLVKQMTRNAATAQVSDKHLMIFFDARAIDVEDFARFPAPKGVTVDLIPLHLGTATIDDVIKIYRVDKESLDGEEKAGA